LFLAEEVVDALAARFRTEQQAERVALEDGSTVHNAF
jgi:hypothetical protein